MVVPQGAGNDIPPPNIVGICMRHGKKPTGIQPFFILMDILNQLTNIPHWYILLDILTDLHNSIQLCWSFRISSKVYQCGLLVRLFRISNKMEKGQIPVGFLPCLMHIPTISGGNISLPVPCVKSSEEYEVDKIVGEKRYKGRNYYKVRWKGYDAEDDTWQSARDLRNAPELLLAWKGRL